MRPIVILLTMAFFLGGGSAVSAWNGPGHMVIARIAYERLTPAIRKNADALLASHPEYRAWKAAAQGVVTPDKIGEAVFMIASTWSDEIKGDPRFYNDVKHEEPKPLADHYPDMAQHTNWHFTDIPLSQDGTSTPPLSQEDPQNAVLTLNRLMDEVKHTTDRGRKVYDLPWILHITGDIHQPLHCCSRFSRLHPKGDLGGNLFVLAGGMKLHRLWDDLIAPGSDYHKPEHTGWDLATAFATPLAPMDSDTRRMPAAGTPEKWAREGFEIAGSFVYTVGVEDPDNPPAPSDAYIRKARRVAGQRALLAGIRLANLLNGENLR